MSIEAMKQALESLEKQHNWMVANGGAFAESSKKAIFALEKAIEQAEKQEGLPQDFIVHEVEKEGDWSEWVCPDPEQYFMKCCDCGLVHEMQFKVVKYSVGDKCVGVNDPDVRGIFRARRRINA
jgi:hypothetical protein